MPKKKRDYAAENRRYKSRPDQIKKRVARNKARRMMIRKYGKAALKGKEVDHKDRNPTNNSLSNLRILSAKANNSRKKKK